MVVNVSYVRASSRASGGHVTPIVVSARARTSRASAVISHRQTSPTTHQFSTELIPDTDKKTQGHTDIATDKRAIAQKLVTF